MVFKPLKWKMKERHCHVYCGKADIAFIVWRRYKYAKKVKGHYSVFLFFGEGDCEHVIPSDNIKHAKLFVKDKWKQFKKEITVKSNE